MLKNLLFRKKELTDLNANQEYKFRIAAHNKDGQSTFRYCEFETLKRNKKVNAFPALPKTSSSLRSNNQCKSDALSPVSRKLRQQPRKEKTIINSLKSVDEIKESHGPPIVAEPYQVILSDSESNDSDVGFYDSDASAASSTH